MGFLGSIMGGVLAAFVNVLGFLIYLVSLLTSGILFLSAKILEFVLSPNFISLSYTDPANNEFIRIGWELTRGLTNIIFVFALIAIGLGTALRLTGYQAKKALPLLIIIALLINFTPVILGVIVDAANIVMNYFLVGAGGAGNVLTNSFSAASTNITNTLGDFFDPSSAINNVVAALAIILFNLIAAFILFIFSFIFIMRYVAIWLLVILSPLAFACYILPATKKVWNMWWTQFIQWTIIGITASFFLYLSNQLIEQVISKGEVTFGSTGEGLGIVDLILPWGVAIAFLFLGLMMAFSTSAMGSKFAINLGKKTTSWTRGKAWQQTGQRWLSAQAQKAQDKQGLLYDMAGARWKDTKGWKKAVLAPFAAAGAFHGARALGRKGLATGTGKMEDQIEKEKGGLKKQFGKNTDAMAQAFSKDWSYEKRIAAGLVLAGEGDFSKLKEEDRDIALNDALAYSRDAAKDILRADPSLIDKDKNKGSLELLLKGRDKENYLSGAMTISDARKKASEVLMKEIIRSKDIDNYDSSFFLDEKYGKDRMEYAILHWGTEYWNKIATNPKFSEEVHNKFNAIADGISAKEISKTNAAYLRFRAANPIGVARYGPMEGYEDVEKINALAKQIKGGPAVWTKEEEAIIRRTAQIFSQRPGATGTPQQNWLQAEQDFRQLKNNLRQWEKDLPEVKPPISKRESIQFRKIAEDVTRIPKTENENTLRKVRGGLRSAFYGMEKAQKDMQERALELEQVRPTAAPDHIRQLENELHELENKFKDYRNNFDSLKIKELSIKQRLNIP